MQSINLFLLIVGITGISSYGAVNWVRLKLDQQFVDIPNARSSHAKPVSRGGSLGFIAVLIPAILVYNWSFSSVLPTLPYALWASFLPLVIVGLIDDQRGLPASLRYGVQLLVSVLLVCQIGAFPQPWLEGGTIGSGLAYVTTAIGLTAFMNFYNFMDGLDGLVAGCCLVQAVYCAAYTHHPSLLLVAAVLLGFLAWNWSPAKIFMGDAGSTTLGAVIPAFLLVSAQLPASHSVQESWASLVVTLPLVADALYTLLRRWRRGENVFQAHKSHLYQRLNQAGLSHSQVAWAYVSATVVVAIGLLFTGLIGAIITTVALGLTIAYLELMLSSRLMEKEKGDSLAELEVQQRSL